MTHQITLDRVPQRRLAGFLTRATRATLAGVITSGPAWTFLRQNGIPNGGHNIVVYRDREGETLAPGEFFVEVCVNVMEPFAEGDGVVNGWTPQGLSAHAKHVGPYSAMSAAHGTILAWCRTNNRHLAGPSWEVYGHWNDDPALLETDIFHLVED